jgi:hypothetical protein
MYDGQPTFQQISHWHYAVYPREPQGKANYLKSVLKKKESSR